MNVTFADTHYYFALLNRTDVAHQRAVEATLRLNGRVVTTDWVLTELGDGMSAPNKSGRVSASGRAIAQRPGRDGDPR